LARTVLEIYVQYLGGRFNRQGKGLLVLARKRRMKFLQKLVLSLTLVLAASSLVQGNLEAYMHDPLDNPKVVRDTVVAPENVFGFAPAKKDKEHPDSTLSKFAKVKFSSFAEVERYRKARIEYHELVVERLDALMTKELTLEEKARAAVKLRNDARLASFLDAKGQVKPGFEKGYQNALESAKKYTYAYFRNEKGLNDEEIIQSAYGTNAGMDAVLGLYDRYFSTYKILLPSRTVKSLNPIEKRAYDKVYARFVKMSIKKRDNMSYLYFMEPKTAAKMLVHLANWYEAPKIE